MTIQKKNSTRSRKTVTVEATPPPKAVAPANRLNRTARLRWVPLNLMKVSPSVTQRTALRKNHVQKIAANFDPEKFGVPTVNWRDGYFWIIDGWHRTEGYKKWLGDGWEDQSVQCWTFEGLTDDEMAEQFLGHQTILPMDAFSTFHVAITAQRKEECDIDRIVRSQDLRVSTEKIPGAIRSVATLRKVYALGDSTLARTLRIARDAYGDAGLGHDVIGGLGLLCHRYNGQLDDADAVKKLGSCHGGVNGLLNAAEKLRLQTGNRKNQCVAAAAVNIVNRGNRGTKKLPDWWAAS